MPGSRNGEIQRAIMARGDDGVWDILLGSILVVVGLIEFLAWHPAWAVSVLLVLPLALLAKRLVTAPRLRDFETRQTPSCSIGTAVGILSAAILLLSLLTGLLLWLQASGQLSVWAGELLPIVMPIALAALAVIIMVTIGTLIESAVRYSIYAAVLAAGFMALLWEATPSWVAFLVPGAVMVVVGLACVARFTRSRPLVPQESRLRFRF